MSRRVVLKSKSGAIGVQSVVIFEDGGGDRARRRGWESVLPAFDARDLRKMFARVLLRQDAGSGFVQPLVAAGMIEVPVSVDQLLDGVRIDARQSGGNIRTRGDDFCIHEQLPVGAGKNSDVSARPKRTLILRRRV